ncbi:hypothetical protein PABY_17930 [Pyrodictium abyssi]|uniref:Uncharacterized protein n=2 Tax=Pyrodictium abyssi TaxID=54256 RepID=A0ABN6ZPQ4_9CREN|nr:hypothetical protein PABY_17930 [Pyrodictium abyssi]
MLSPVGILAMDANDAAEAAKAGRPLASTLVLVNNTALVHNIASDGEYIYLALSVSPAFSTSYGRNATLYLLRLEPGSWTPRGAVEISADSVCSDKDTTMLYIYAAGLFYADGYLYVDANCMSNPGAVVAVHRDVFDAAPGVRVWAPTVYGASSLRVEGVWVPPSSSLYFLGHAEGENSESCVVIGTFEPSMLGRSIGVEVADAPGFQLNVSKAVVEPVDVGAGAATALAGIVRVEDLGLPVHGVEVSNDSGSPAYCIHGPAGSGSKLASAPGPGCCAGGCTTREAETRPSRCRWPSPGYRAMWLSLGRRRWVVALSALGGLGRLGCCWLL